MMYSVNINQLAWTYFVPKAKIKHALVFSAIRSMHKSDSPKMVRNAEGYTWISSSAILKEVPILGLTTKAALSSIFKFLAEQNLILIMKEPGTNRHFYSTTEFSSNLYRGENDLKSFQINEALTNVNRAVNKRKQGCKQTLTNHITIDHITKDQNICDKEKSHEMAELQESSSLLIKNCETSNSPDFVDAISPEIKQRVTKIKGYFLDKRLESHTNLTAYQLTKTEKNKLVELCTNYDTEFLIDKINMFFRCKHGKWAKWVQNTDFKFTVFLRVFDQVSENKEVTELLAKF